MRSSKNQLIFAIHVDLLHEIPSWADGPDDRCIFWLSDLASVSKSTIAQTVARMCLDEQRLAAIIFSHSGGNVSHAAEFVAACRRE